MSKKKKYNGFQKNQKETPKKKDTNVSGFNTLNQVVGAPEHRIKKSTAPIAEPKTIKEPHDICPLCGKPIDSIATSFTSPEGKYVHFDCVLDELKKKTQLSSNQTISYIGTGNFAIVEKDEEGKYVIVSRIPYEKAEATNLLRDYIQENKNL